MVRYQVGALKEFVCLLNRKTLTGGLHNCESAGRRRRTTPSRETARRLVSNKFASFLPCTATDSLSLIRHDVPRQRSLQSRLRSRPQRSKPTLSKHPLALFTIFAGIPVFGLAGTIQEETAKELGLPFVAELYGDVKYSKDGKLVIDRKKKAWTSEETKKHISSQVENSSVTAVTGEEIELPIGVSSG